MKQNFLYDFLNEIDVKRFSDEYGYKTIKMEENIRKLRTAAAMTPLFQQVFVSHFKIKDDFTSNDVERAVFDYITDPTARTSISDRLELESKSKRQVDFMESHGYSKEVDENFTEAYKLYNRDRKIAEEHHDALEEIVKMVRDAQSSLHESLKEKWDLFTKMVKNKKQVEIEAINCARLRWSRMNSDEKKKYNNDFNIIVAGEVATAKIEFERVTRSDVEFQKKLKAVIDDIRKKESPEISHELRAIFRDIEMLTNYEENLSKIKTSIDRLCRNKEELFKEDQ